MVIDLFYSAYFILFILFYCFIYIFIDLFILSIKILSIYFNVLFYFIVFIYFIDLFYSIYFIGPHRKISGIGVSWQKKYGRAGGNFFILFYFLFF